MKRILLLLLVCTLLCGCVGKAPPTDDGRLRVVTTIFPLYDFVRAVGGDRVDITLLIDPGIEVHSYDPTPSDIMAVHRADLVVCVGGESEKWVDAVLREVNLIPLVMMEQVELLTEDRETEYDEHIWTSPSNAIRLVEAVRDALIAADPAGVDGYRSNCDDYTARIAAVGKRIDAAVKGAEQPFLLVADRFPFKYFATEFHLPYEAAFGGCASSTDLNPKTMMRLLNTVRERGLTSAFYVEMSNRQVADALAQETGVALYELHSAHNVTLDQFRAGVTYAELMERNAETLERTLQ